MRPLSLRRPYSRNFARSLNRNSVVIWSYFILFYSILSYPILSYPILSYLMLSYPYNYSVYPTIIISAPTAIFSWIFWYRKAQTKMGNIKLCGIENGYCAYSRCPQFPLLSRRNFYLSFAIPIH